MNKSTAFSTMAAVLISSRFKLKLIDGERESFIAQRTLAAIDSVHRDGAFPIVEIKDDPEIHYVACYRSKVKEVAFTADSETPSLDLCHEVAHVLDHLAVSPNPPAFDYRASESSPAMEECLNTIDRSPQIAFLKESYSDSPDGFIGNLIEPRELWARAYAQYITLKSGDSVLAQELELVLGSPERLRASEQWTERDFRDILVAIDEPFVSMGWL